MTRNSCKKKIPAPSDERARKQDEALSKGADMVRCIHELQSITNAETGEDSPDVDFALTGSYEMAAGLAGAKAGADRDEIRKTLKSYGYPDILD